MYDIIPTLSLEKKSIYNQKVQVLMCRFQFVRNHFLYILERLLIWFMPELSK